MTSAVALATTTPSSTSAGDDEGAGRAAMPVSDTAAGDAGSASSPDVKDAVAHGDVEIVVAAVDGRREEDGGTGEVAGKRKEVTPDSDSVFDTAPSTPASPETQRPCRVDKSDLRKSHLNKAASAEEGRLSFAYIMLFCVCPPPPSPSSSSSSPLF